MPINTPSFDPTEQQLEAEIRATLKRVFPFLKGSEIRHQTTFTFRFGHAEIVSGRNQESARSRSDILVFFRDKPLAVLELKRQGTGITDDDDAQGLSYARVLHPQPPLVVVTDGYQTRILETYTGDPWKAENRSELAVETLFRNAASVAASDLKDAIGVLMGTDPAIWMQAVRETTALSLGELTGSWDEPLCPFVKGFLLHRRATFETKQLLEAKKRLILIDGAPLAGKSNLLRELALMTRDHASIAVLYIDADPGLDLFEALSDLLSGSLDWPVTRDEARQWLRTLSRANQYSLVLAIDNMRADRDNLRRDVELVTSNQFGAGVRVVLVTDDTVENSLVKLRNGRSTSTLGKRAVHLKLEHLDEDEFKFAVRAMKDIHIGIVRGGQHSPELRMPWILRAMCADIATRQEYLEEGFGAMLEPVPGLRLLHFSRKHFDVSQRPFSLYRELAQAVIDDGKDSQRPYELKLELLDAFIVRRTTVQKYISSSEIDSLIEDGLIREGKSSSGDNIFVIRIPELLASEFARILEQELSSLCRADPPRAAAWLAGAAGNFPLGDVIAAQALIDCAARDRGISLKLIECLTEAPPVPEILPSGTKAAVMMAGVGIVNMTVKDGGTLLLQHGTSEELRPPEPGESAEQVVYSDVHPWLILSHIAGYPSAVVPEDLPDEPRIDPILLLKVGACPIVLRRPGGDPLLNSIPVHDLPDGTTMVCHTAGIVEPITWSLFRFLFREPIEESVPLIDEAIRRAQPSLLGRLDIALRTLAGTDDEKADWATKIRSELVGPALLLGIGATFVHE
jgi:Type I restriction enzyme R protein N terminus (HSDR_N)